MRYSNSLKTMGFATMSLHRQFKHDAAQRLLHDLINQLRDLLKLHIYHLAASDEESKTSSETPFFKTLFTLLGNFLSYVIQDFKTLKLNPASLDKLAMCVNDMTSNADYFDSLTMDKHQTLIELLHLIPSSIKQALHQIQSSPVFGSNKNPDFTNITRLADELKKFDGDMDTWPSNIARAKAQLDEAAGVNNTDHHRLKFKQP